MFPRLGRLQGWVELARCCRHQRLWGQWMKMHRRWLSAFCPPVRPVRPNGSLLFIGGPRRRGDDCSKPNLGVPARLVSGTPSPRPPSMETPTQSGAEKLLSHHPRWRSHRGVTWWLACVHSFGCGTAAASTERPKVTEWERLSKLVKALVARAGLTQSVTLCFGGNVWRRQTRDWSVPYAHAKGEVAEPI